MNHALPQPQLMTLTISWLRVLLRTVLLAILLGWTIGGPIVTAHAAAPSELPAQSRYERRITRENLRHLNAPARPIRVVPQQFSQTEPRHIPVVMRHTGRR